MYHGIAVSPGVTVARAFCFDAAFETGVEEVPPADVSAELSRFNQACEAAAAELCALIEKVSFEIGERESAIFRAHLLMLRDRAFVAKTKSYMVDGRRPAAAALRATLGDYEKLFSTIDDEYLRERIVDLRDVVTRVLNHLIQEGNGPPPDVQEPVVLVAEELFPSQTLGPGKLKIAAIVTERGGQTSHAAIIARSMGIPAVAGIANVTREIKTGDLLVVEGHEGCVLVNPGPEAEAAYRKRQREFFDLKGYLIENRDQPAVTADGHPIELLANVNSVADARAAVDVGAKGIGLYRTEYLFMTHRSIPDEEEQYQCYKSMVEASPNRVLTIRTLDLGGDKTVPYLGSHRETNPFLGWRSIRLSFEHPEFFRKQIRAILRAGAEGNVRMMFPMITTVEELRHTNRMVWQAKAELARQNIPFARDLPVGIMIEVPAAAVCIDHMLDHTSFVSIGTNDLVQYLMAADRDNPKVAHLCDPLSPAVLRLLKQTIEACNARGVPVTVCGEMAGRPRCILVLLAFGLRSFSMSPALVPMIKELIHTIRMGDLRKLAGEVLRRRSGRQVREFLNSVLHSIHPRLAQLEPGP